MFHDDGWRPIEQIGRQIRRPASTHRRRDDLVVANSAPISESIRRPSCRRARRLTVEPWTPLQVNTALPLDAEVNKKQSHQVDADDDITTNLERGYLTVDSRS